MLPQWDDLWIVMLSNPRPPPITSGVSPHHELLGAMFVKLVPRVHLIIRLCQRAVAGLHHSS